MPQPNHAKNVVNQYRPYLDIDMRYYRVKNHRKRGLNKKEFIIKLAARFGFVSAITCEHVFCLRRAKVLEFLSKLVSEGLLALAKTDRSKEGRIYILTHCGASYASELMRISIPFRSASEPITQVNQNAIMHDSIISYVLNAGLHNKTIDGQSKPLWSSYLTEIEFKRVHAANAIKNVDGIVMTTSGELAALELENSFKRKKQHEVTLLKLRDALLSDNPLFDKVFIVPCSERIYADTQRFYEQLFEELPQRKERNSQRPLLTSGEATKLREKVIFRTKFIEDIENTFYR